MRSKQSQRNVIVGEDNKIHSEEDEIHFFL